MVFGRRADLVCTLNTWALTMTTLWRSLPKYSLVLVLLSLLLGVASACTAESKPGEVLYPSPTPRSDGGILEAKATRTVIPTATPFIAGSIPLVSYGECGVFAPGQYASIELLEDMAAGCNIDAHVATFKGDFNYLGYIAGDVNLDFVRFEGKADFSGAVFSSNAVFSNVTFNKGVKFGGRFLEDVSFEGSNFSETADFARSTFEGSADFSEVNFARGANFFLAIFREKARFDEARFGQPAEFLNAYVFDGREWMPEICTGTPLSAFFDQGRFQAGASFNRIRSDGCFSAALAEFLGDTKFAMADFSEPVDFSVSVFDAADFSSARFRDKVTFDGVNVGGKLNLQGAEASSTIEAPESVGLLGGVDRQWALAVAENHRALDAWTRVLDVAGPLEIEARYRRNMAQNAALPWIWGTLGGVLVYWGLWFCFRLQDGGDQHRQSPGEHRKKIPFQAEGPERTLLHAFVQGSYALRRFFNARPDGTGRITSLVPEIRAAIGQALFALLVAFVVVYFSA